MASLSAASLQIISEFAQQGLVNMAWAFSELLFKDLPLFAAISSASIPKMRDLPLNQLAIMAWSYARLVFHDRPLIQSISAAALPRITSAHAALCSETSGSGSEVECLQDLKGSLVEPKELLTFLHVLQSADWMENGLLEAGTSLLMEVGELLDRASSNRLETAPVRQAELQGAALRSPDLGGEPRAVSCQSSMCLLWKPPGWTVSVGKDHLHTVGAVPLAEEQDDDHQAADYMGVSQGRQLQEWVAEHYGSTWSISRDDSEQFGLLHRLDRGTSGMIACALTYKAFYLGKLEFYLGRVRKCYVCVCHGHARPFPEILDAPLKVVSEGSVKRSIVSHDGVKTCTEVCLVGHFVGPDEEAFSLVEVRLHTGRMHQIRSHLSSMGFPLLGDTLYGGSGRSWFRRTFLHESRLGLDMGGEGVLDGTCPLPRSLREALEWLEVADMRSLAVRERWLAAQDCVMSPHPEG